MLWEFTQFIAIDFTSISNGPWLLLVIGGLLAVMGLLGAIRNREHGLLLRSFASLVAIAGGGLAWWSCFRCGVTCKGLHVSADIASILHTSGVRTEFGVALGFWVMVAGIRAGLVGGWITSHKLRAEGCTRPRPRARITWTACGAPRTPRSSTA